MTISLRFRRPQFKGPIWTLSEVISSSLAPVSHSFIRCRTVRRGSAGRPGSARPATRSRLGSVWLGPVRRRMESSPQCGPAWPGPARRRKGYLAVTAARLRRRWNTIVKVASSMLDHSPLLVTVVKHAVLFSCLCCLVFVSLDRFVLL